MKMNSEYESLIQNIPGLQNYVSLVDRYTAQKKTGNPFTCYYRTDENHQPVPLLNRLIQLHDKDDAALDFLCHIQCLIERGADPNFDEALHLACELNKFDVIESIFKVHANLKKKYDEALAENKHIHLPKELALNTRDKKGLTLIHHIINMRDLDALKFFLKQAIGVNVMSKCRLPDGKDAELLPLHQAVFTNCNEAIPLLIELSSDSLTPCGDLEETPLLLAARFIRPEALQAILVSESRLNLKQENKEGNTAIELLTAHLKEKKELNKVLESIAMLLCHGSEVPNGSELAYYLEKHRSKLLIEVQRYLASYPKLASNFISRCHNKNQALHDIVYARNNFGQKLSYLFGRVDNFAFNLERLVREPEQRTTLQKDEILFAQFAERYRDTYDRAFFKNPWSSMLHKIASGEITSWHAVKLYAKAKPHSRTAQVFDKLKEDLFSREEENNEQLSKLFDI